MDTISERLMERLLAALGLTLLTAPGCVETLGTGGDDITAGAACGREISQIICGMPPTATGSSGTADGSTGGSPGTGDETGASTGDTGDTGDTGSMGTGTTGTTSAMDSTSTGDGASTGEAVWPEDERVIAPREVAATEGTCETPEVNVDFCAYWISETFEMNGECCREYTGYVDCCDGRPFVVHDQARVAPTTTRRDWATALEPSLEGLDPNARSLLAQAWTEDGQMEHASIASFARFVLQLVAQGTPPSLVADAQQALADEIEHARACFGLASAYAGHPVGPGALPVDDALAGPQTLVAITVAAVREGCIGETLAAYQAEVAAGRAEDPTVRAVLEAIAEDEARHAVLAWRFVDWAIERGGDEIREAVAQAVEDYGTALAEDPRPAPIDPDTWRAHGRLAPREQREVMVRGLQEIVLPCAHALLQTRPEQSSTSREADPKRTVLS